MKSLQSMRTLIVSASLALMLSAVFAPFLGAIAMVFGVVVEGRWSRSFGSRWLHEEESPNLEFGVCCAQKLALRNSDTKRAQMCLSVT